MILQSYDFADYDFAAYDLGGLADKLVLQNFTIVFCLFSSASPPKIGVINENVSPFSIQFVIW